MRGNLKSAQIRLLGLLLLFLATASGVFAFSAAKSHQAKPSLSVETALKAIDFAAENDISIDSEFSANLRQSINFNRNRYYSPALGRFISKDPIGFNGGMNLYRYADNNPVLFVDPFGLASIDCNKEYKDLKINLIHIYNGASTFPYDKSRIESSFSFVNDVSHFSVDDLPVSFSKPIGLIAWNDRQYNPATIEAFSFGTPSSSNVEVVNVILSETNFGAALYGLASPIGGRRALVDWNNGQHLGNPVNRTWTIVHESGHALGLEHRSGTVMQGFPESPNWGVFHFNLDDQETIKKELEK